MKKILLLSITTFIFLQCNILFASSIADAINSSVGNSSVTSPQTHENNSITNNNSNSNSNSNSSSTSKGTTIEMDENFIKNMKDIRTRRFRIEGGAVNIDGKIYYKDDDESFHNGWIKENSYWYYFDPALVRNEL